MTAERVLQALLVAAVAVGWARLAWWQARAPEPVRARWWRVASLAVAQPVAASLLYLTLMPPAVGGAAATLIVATADAPRLAGGAIVALPEAPAMPGAERVPDLATALRRHPGTARIRVIGGGLEPRDRDAARGLALAFDAPADRRGLVALAAPPPVAPGDMFRIGGRVAGVSGGRVELLDPAGARVDVKPLSAQGDFAVTGTARVAGVALARLRVLDRAGALVEQAEVPVRTSDAAQPRLLILAGAASPEVKYLRRWATDAGLAVVTRITAGGGVVLGDAPVAIDAATLARTDVAIVDERSWAELRTRAALVAAVRSGMGLVVRITGPVPDATRGQWRAIGIAASGGAATAPAILDGMPAMTRRLLAPTPAAVPLWRDARGAVLADWRAVGRGRVAAWSVVDAFALVLTGHGDVYGDALGRTIAAVARARGGAGASIPPLPRVGERMTVCAIGTGARVDATTLAIDAASGCAGYWPNRSGWHVLADRATALPFYVHPAAAFPALRAHERAEATARLRGASPVRTGTATPARGASWPWFIALLAVLGATWWFERARFGRRTPQTGAKSA